jgi:2,3-bisphosphoglycerate-independent phosphoglycerate mutase
VDERHFRELTVEATTKIVYLIMDGLGGFASPDRGSELMESRHPHLDELATFAACGVLDPVGPGITPGSGPGHLALFGYDPEIYELGRGALSAAGLGVELRPGDVAARVNLATLDEKGCVVDRRAGRISTEEAEKLCQSISAQVSLSVPFELLPEKEHRALLVLRGPGLSPAVHDTDPQLVGVEPLAPIALDPEAARTAQAVEDLDRQARQILSGERANVLIFRGFDTLRELPSFADRYKLRALAIASYPMYIGISRILGMEALPAHSGLAHQLDSLEHLWGRYDFFYFHVKATDSAGEDGDFARKCAAIEEVDQQVVPRIRDLDPDVIVVSGDHSTPTQLAAHSWHPVPVLLYARSGQRDACVRFDEPSCAGGAIGRMRSKDLMPQVLAAAGRLTKFGA